MMMMLWNYVAVHINHTTNTRNYLKIDKRKKRTFTEPTTVFLSPSFNLAIKAYPTIKKLFIV